MIESMHSQKGIAHILVLLVVLIGLGFGIYLVQQQQIFKSRASIDLSSAFKITDDKGSEIRCAGDTCFTDEETVYLRLKDLAPLAQ